MSEVEVDEKPRKEPQDKLPKRKKKREKEYVFFEVENYEGEFKAPSLNSVSLKVQRKLLNGDLGPLVDEMDEYGEIVDDMLTDEIKDFLDAWAKASGVELTK